MAKNLMIYQFPANDCFVEAWIKENGENSGSSEPQHVVWGILSICLLASPGLFLITQSDGPMPDNFGLLIKTCSTRNLKYCTKAVTYAIILICYPITLLLAQLTAILTNDVEWFKISMLMIGLEAFFQSLPQFLLQMFMVVNGFSLTITQFLLFMISIMLRNETVYKEGCVIFIWNCCDG